MIIYITLSILFAIGCMWPFIANEWTFRDKMKIHNWIFAKRENEEFFEWTARMAEDKKVSYDKHLWYRATFRNPMKLYPTYYKYINDQKNK